MTKKLYELSQVPTLQGWPYSPWQTGRLIRQGKLGAVRVGRRVFVTEALIEEFIARHTVTTPGAG